MNKFDPKQNQPCRLEYFNCISYWSAFGILFIISKLFILISLQSDIFYRNPDDHTSPWCVTSLEPPEIGTCDVHVCTGMYVFK